MPSAVTSRDETLSDDQKTWLKKEVPAALADGVALLDWWRKTDPDMGYRKHYPETKTRNRPDDRSYGFFDSALIPSAGKAVPINGNVQEMFYDEPKAPPGDDEERADRWMNDQVREFILQYFMRISDFRQPQPAESGGDDGQVSGFGFSQLYQKRRDSDEATAFASAERDKIVDLRRLRKEYEWIVLKNPIFGFGFDFKPFGPLFDKLFGVSGPQVKLPADVFNYLVMSNAFIVDERPDPAKSEESDPIVGRYGFGYAFVNDPEPSVYGYGPGQLQPAFEQMVWEVRQSGKVGVRAAFVAREPRRILNLSVDPLAWGFQFTKALGGEVPGFLRPAKRFWDKLPLTNATFDPVLPAVDLLNVLSVGQADRIFGLSRDQIIKQALFLHFLQHYQTIVGSLQTWRQVKDWTVPEKLTAKDKKAGREPLPDWVISGVSA